MKVKISRSNISGTVRAPASKSYTIRALVCAGLASGESLIENPLDAEDTNATRRVLRGLGVIINDKDSDCWRVRGGALKASGRPLFCGDSAATLRFMAAVCAGIPGLHHLVPGPSLARRPITPLLDTLNRLGASCAVENGAVVIHGDQAEGGQLDIPGDISSQFISALLLLAPRLKHGLTLELSSPPVSRPYLEMTRECLGAFAVQTEATPDHRHIEVSHQEYKPASYSVEGDWSSASYLLALGAVSGEVTVTGLNSESFQGDRIVLQCLRQMGASVVAAPGATTVRQSGLNAVSINLADCIDLLPTLAVLAALARGTSVFTGIRTARLKESNRVMALCQGLSRMGIKVIEEEDTLSISGGKPSGAVIDSFGDHRIAMAFGVLATAVGNVAIDTGECVAKTYPGFWQTLSQLGVLVEIENGQHAG